MTTTTQDVKCPACKGRRQEYVHLNYGGTRPGEWRFLDCLTCNGSGTVTPEHLARIDRGTAMRADRLHRKVTLRAEAAALGCTPSELSDAESGRASAETLAWIEGARAGRATA